MKKLISLISKDEAYKLQVVIEEVMKNEESQAKEYKSGTSYINPCALRIGTLVKSQKRIFFAISSEYSPV